ncbi:MAG: TatD family hydrolase [Patescibacteria group bacterium]
MKINYIDIHSHIHDKEFDKDRDEVLARMKESNIATITIGTHLESSRKAVALAEKESLVYATVGIHPTDTKVEIVSKELEELAHHKKVVAIGECGLDYFRGSTSEVEKKRQRALFESQIELAIKVDKPLMIHGRPSRGSMDAYLDILEILTPYKLEHGEHLRGNIHFFSGNKEIAQKFLDLGFTMSFTGVVTFTHDYNDVIRFLPLTSIMSETDSPYVAPVPYRDKRNEPLFIRETAAQIARIRGENENMVAEALFKNAIDSFGLHDLFD